MYAVIELQWHQYIVKQWDKIIVDNIWKKEWDKVVVDKVLLFFDENWENVEIWKPYIDGKRVELTVVENFKDKKINVIKFKNKNRYFRKYWFRPQKTVLQVDKIS